MKRELLDIRVTDRSGRYFNRRNFLARTGAAAVAFSVLSPELVCGAGAGDKIKLGLVGCGKRGAWITNLFLKHGGYNLVAVADYFQDRTDEIGDKFKVDGSKRFTGLSGYKKLLEQKLDAVAIESPAYFHPEHAAAATDAGKHVYCAKPVAVDVPGCRTIEASGKKASQSKLVFLVDFQTRSNPAYQQAVQLVHEGKIGEIFAGEATYQCGTNRADMDELLASKPGDMETRLRAWMADKQLSGDVITEQNIHALDVASWIINRDPIKAYGTGGRKRIPAPNGCWDHFAVIFQFPNFLLSFNSKKVGKGWDDIQCRVYGMEGTIDTHYAGEVRVKSDDAFNGGKLANLFTDGVVTNIVTFHDRISSGDCSNSTVAPAVRSNLLTILGRTAAYQGAEVTWSGLLKANEKIELDFKGLKA